MKRSSMLSVCVLAGTAVSAFAGATPLDTIRVASGLVQPLFVTWAPGDHDRMFVVEKVTGTNQGRIRIVNMTTQPGTILGTPFLTLNSVSTGSEQGLLCMAFHPQYQTNGKFYISYTNTAGNSVIAQYNVSGDPNVADAGSAVQVFGQTQPFSNHNGGWIGFGPDGYLYCAYGDGGSAGDPGNRAQNINLTLGKMLRLDVNGDDFPGDATRNYRIPADNPFAGAIAGADEVWSYGLRNPWRNSFDRETGDMWIGDVGQNAFEEIDFEPANTPGRNYGWRCYEGNSAFNTTGCLALPGPYIFPVHAYGRGLGFSTTGGYMYRGSAICDLRGTYFFADYGSAAIWSFVYAGAPNPAITTRTAELAPGSGLSISTPASFGEDLDGELYICDINGGEVFKIIAGAPGAECVTLIPGDTNCDGIVSVADIGPFVLALTDPAGYAATYPNCNIDTADVNDDGVVSTSDIGPFVGILTGA